MKLPIKMPSFSPFSYIIAISLFGVIAVTLFMWKIFLLQDKESDLEKRLGVASSEVNKTIAELKKVQSEDQYVKNKKLEKDIADIEKTYKTAVTLYENILDLRAQKTKTDKLDELLANSLHLLSQRNYASATTQLAALQSEIQKTKDSLTVAAIPANVPVNNTPPSSGYQRQSVKTDIGTYLVDIISADLNSTRVIVETASNGDCSNDCPVASLADYVGRAGAFAGVNGPYFCPAEYPSCADKKNSFDTLLMNKNKVYFNSANNVYSSVPAVIFSGSSARFVGASSEWGRDTGVDSVIAAQPMLLSGGNITFGGDGDPKKGSKGSRAFIGTTGSTIYIGVVHGVTVAESAIVLKSLGVFNALNLDSGGSTALWSGRYIVGPGRNTPFGILLVRK
ncbi:phosphodiester glycosidase family protein [Candidatus Gottesmanbacteria bacterium]|nr:phosphodiester glycosidase family protein [Candidatus Gottesmanbacteria bacterium]